MHKWLTGEDKQLPSPVDSCNARLCDLDGTLQYAGSEILDHHQEQHAEANVPVDHIDDIDQCIKRDIQAYQGSEDAEHTHMPMKAPLPASAPLLLVRPRLVMKTASHIMQKPT